MTSPTPTLTGTWTTTGALVPTTTWDGQHDGPVTLTDGRILVAGGADAAGAPVTRSARFAPDTGAWTPTAPLHNPRRRHSLTLLDDGTVLATGGTSAATQFPPPALASTERFTPGPGTWAVTGALSQARWGHSAVRLPDGSVLVAGGIAVRSAQSVTALRSAERFDPDTGTWTEVAPMTDARSGHVALVLGDGTVLVVGGSVPVGRTDAADLAFCELYDPDTDEWTPTGSLLAPRSFHQAVALSPTSVLVTGGAPPGPVGDGVFDPFSRPTVELYSRSTGTWTAAEPMPSGRSHHRAVDLGDGRALVTGGTDSVRDGSGFAGTLVYDDGEWIPVGGLADGRWDFAATALPDGTVLVVGGVTASGQATASGAGRELTSVTERFSLDDGPVVL